MSASRAERDRDNRSLVLVGLPLVEHCQQPDGELPCDVRRDRNLAMASDRLDKNKAAAHFSRGCLLSEVTPFFHAFPFSLNTTELGRNGRNSRPLIQSLIAVIDEPSLAA